VLAHIGKGGATYRIITNHLVTCGLPRWLATGTVAQR
jgi:hypothetical protein